MALINEGSFVSNEEEQFEGKIGNHQNEVKAQSKIQISVSEKLRPTVEPVLALMIIAETVSVSVITNFFEYKSCLAVLNISADECLNMTQKTESRVQVFTADLLMEKSLLESVLPAALSFFIGPWSDKNGRRLLFLVSIFGFFCFYLSWAILSAIPTVPIQYYLFPSLPKALTGGWVVIFVASYCYMVDITSIESRTFRIGLMETGLTIGYGLGFFLSPIFLQFGFTFVFSASALISFVCFLYSYFCVQETIKPEMGIDLNCFDWKYVYDMIATTFYERPHKRRCIVFLSLTSFFINIVIFVGESSVSYLWLKLQFQWNLHDFTTYQMFSVSIIGAGSFFCLWLFSARLRFPDLPLATVVCISRVLSSLLLSFSYLSWHIYAASCVAMFSGAVGPLLRATVSKIIPKNEIGKVFALIAALESIAPLAGTPLYTLVYDSVIYSTPSYVFLVSTSFYTVITIFFMMIIYIQWRYPGIEFSSLNDGSITS